MDLHYCKRYCDAEKIIVALNEEDIMKISLKNIIVALLLFVGSGSYFFFQASNNTQPINIKRIFQLNARQANSFYFVLGCLCILMLILCVVALYIYPTSDKKLENAEKTLNTL